VCSAFREAGIAVDRQRRPRNSCCCFVSCRAGLGPVEQSRRRSCARSVLVPLHYFAEHRARSVLLRAATLWPWSSKRRAAKRSAFRR
jgi:hypothetical protein